MVPFWAITKHADIIEVARQPRIFLNAPRLVATTKDQSVQGDEMLYHNLLNMDPPEHAKYRDLVNRSFTPRAVRSLLREVEGIASDVMTSPREAALRRLNDRMRLCDGRRCQGTARWHRCVARRPQSRSHETLALDQRSHRIERSGIRTGGQFREERWNEPAPVSSAISRIWLKSGVKIRRGTSPVRWRPRRSTGSLCGR